MAARLKRERPDLVIETVAGGPGEIRVEADGRDLYDASRLWYPRPSSIVRAVTEQLGGAAE
ncbi:MAG: hypothetical protein WD278_06330 [Pirellulales bacterium]